MKPIIRKVIHETHYDYQQPAECSQQICILRPIESVLAAAGALRKGQHLNNHVLKIQPNPSTVANRVDACGNTVTHFEINFPHDSLSVISESELEVTPRIHADIVTVAAPAWDSLAKSFAYQPGVVVNTGSHWRFPSKHVPIHDDLAAYGNLDFWPKRPVTIAAFDLMRRIHKEFKYESGSTTIQTTVQDVMQTRKGVCQDFAHVMLAVLRSKGLSARYVSGYMLTDPPPGQPKLLGADASHAWVSVWCGPEIGWVDYDPTNNQLPDVRYVTVAVGRDYADVPPLRGVVHGGGAATLNVAVTVL